MNKNLQAKEPKPDYFAGLEFENTDLWSRTHHTCELCYHLFLWNETDTKLSNQCRSLRIVPKMVKCPFVTKGRLNSNSPGFLLHI